MNQLGKFRVRDSGNGVYKVIPIGKPGEIYKEGQILILQI